MRYKFLYILIITNLCSIFAVFLCIFYRDHFLSPKQEVEVREKTQNYNYINPLLECNSTTYYNPGKVKTELDDYIEENIGEKNISEIAYYFQMLNSGENFGYNQDSKFSPASLLKLPLSMTLLTHFSIDELYDIDLKYDSQVVPVKRNIGGDNMHNGEFYSGIEILSNMLIESDNIAANTLYLFLGKERVENIFSDLGINASDRTDLGDISVKKYSSFFRVLYNASYLGRKESEFILSVLGNSAYKDGIRYYIPSYIPVSNKFGERAYSDSDEKQLHDCGIVYYPNNPYLICIMTRGTDFDALQKIVQDISKIVYDDIRSKYPFVK